MSSLNSVHSNISTLSPTILFKTVQPTPNIITQSPRPRHPHSHTQNTTFPPLSPKIKSNGQPPSRASTTRMSSVLARRHDSRLPHTHRLYSDPQQYVDNSIEEGQMTISPTDGKSLNPINTITNNTTSDKSNLSSDHDTEALTQESGSASKKPRPSLRTQWSHALLCALAIMVSLMGYSILQERIMTRPYLSPDIRQQTSLDTNVPTAFFRNSLFLVLANRLFAAAIAVLAICLRRNKEELRCRAPLLDYISISLSNVIATSCQYEALKWLTFPTVTIGKCAKMLPVMIILNLRSGKQYSYEDFGIVGGVLIGCAVMISSGNVAAKRSGTAESDTPFGFGLLIAYLLFDAITSTYQERLFDKYDMSVYNQMLYINVSSACLSVVGLAISGGLFESLRFIAMYPRVISDIMMLSVSAVAGQFAITHTIQAFGALLYAGIMTTRQFFSVLASDIIFKHGLTIFQWAGALLVFSSLFYKLWAKARQNYS